MDRSLQSLPASLQAIRSTAKGELIDAAGGVLEFSDLLKRPLDAFKYLQLSVETAKSRSPAEVQLNCVMTARERAPPRCVPEHPEFAASAGGSS